MLTLVVLLLCSAFCFSASAKGELMQHYLLNGMFGTERGWRGSLGGQKGSPCHPWLKCSHGNLLRGSGDEINMSH